MKLGRRKIAALLCPLFFLICFDLGYPTLTRFDTARIPDALQYRNMTVNGPRAAETPFNRRVLIPALAHPIYRLSLGRVGSWDAGFFALLLVNSGFVAGTAVTLFMIASARGMPQVGLLAALLYLVNFSVANQLLAGLVDSGEAFFLMLTVLVLYMDRWGVLPVLVAVGCLAKETMLPLSVCLALTWAVSQKTRGDTARTGAWILISAAVGAVVLTAVNRVLAGHGGSFWQFWAGQIHTPENPVRAVTMALLSRDAWRGFVYLLPLGLAGIKSMPREWRWSVLITVILALLLVVIHSSPQDVGSTFGRATFAISGPLLSLSAAMFLSQKMRAIAKAS